MNKLEETIDTFSRLYKEKQERKLKIKQDESMFDPYLPYFQPFYMSYPFMYSNKEDRRLTGKKGFNLPKKPIGGFSSMKSGPVIPTIINIPVPKITETELEVVHVFPQGTMGYGYPYGGMYSPQMVPSYSITSRINGRENVNNFWGFNNGIQ